MHSYYTWNCPRLCCEGTCSNPAAFSGEPWNQPMSEKPFLSHKPKHQKYIQPTGDTAWKGSQRKQSVLDPYCLTNQSKSVTDPYCLTNQSKSVIDHYCLTNQSKSVIDHYCLTNQSKSVIDHYCLTNQSKSAIDPYCLTNQSKSVIDPYCLTNQSKSVIDPYCLTNQSTINMFSLCATAWKCSHRQQSVNVSDRKHVKEHALNGRHSYHCW